MGEDHLVWLDLHNIHRHRNIQIANVVVILAATKKRCMDFVLWFFYILFIDRNKNVWQWQGIKIRCLKF